VVQADVVTTDPVAVKQFCIEVFEALNVPADDAAIVSDVLVEADLRGVDTHGVALLGLYARRLKAGGINPRPVIRVLQETPSLVLLDGDGGMGQLVGVSAMQKCIDKAKQTGLCAAGVRNSNHYGMAAYYAMMAIPHDMIGFSTTNNEPCLPPFDGLDPATGNNPQAYAIPAGTARPVVIDLAHSVVAFGKIDMAAKLGKPIPVGWAFDENGDPLTDAHEAQKAMRLTPAGGAKGYCLAVVMEALGGVLTGALFGRELLGHLGHLDQKDEVGHFFWALDIAPFMPPLRFKARMDELICQLKGVRLARGARQVYAPGEPELLERERRAREGIPMSRAVFEDLRTLAHELALEERAEALPRRQA
jgi:LDH2 family malate/lactate/ureidoglycolate dehydrogenase